jgi:hypothetical protein
VAEWRIRSICSLIWIPSRYRCRARDVGLGLVVVVVADEILDRVFREEALELAVELRGQRLVRGEDDGRALGFLDHLGHGEGLAGAGRAQKHLVLVQIADALRQLGDRGGLVAGGFELRMHDEPLAALELEVAAQRIDRAAGVGHLFWRVVVHGFLPDRDMLMA